MNTGKVSKEDFVMLSVIGTGTYGKVLLVKRKTATDVNDQKLFAMKILKKGNII